METFIKKVITLIICLLSVTNIEAFALVSNNSVVNNNGISITETEYQNLLNLGFTENEILNMTLTEFEKNKSLKGKIISQNTIYLDKENNILNNNISIFGLQTGYIETAAKKMTTTIVSVNNKYRYKITLEWKQMPSTRSYDIIGIGIENNVKINSEVYFQQNFCYSTNNCSSSIVNTVNSISTGATSTFKLPSSTIVSLSSYLYFDVCKNTNFAITQLNAYGDYSHAVQSISKANANKHSINRGGIVLDTSISNCYDSITTSKAVWTGNW